MAGNTLRRNIFQRILGLCATRPPADQGCWSFENGTVVIDLSRAPELAERGGAVRLEKRGLPERLLVVRDEEDRYHAFRNRCTHAGRRLDHVPESGQVQCCSVGRSTFDYTGGRVSGSAKKDIIPYRAELKGGRLVIEL